MINKLVRRCVAELASYDLNKLEYKYKMDANESPFNIPSTLYNNIMEKMKKLDFNRYPDSDSLELKREISNYVNQSYKKIIVGNGSDEMISLIVNTFVEKNDIVISHSPTFSMYRFFTQIADGEYIEVPSNDNFEVDVDSLIKYSNENNGKIIFLCSPNNPTGNVISKRDIERIVNETNGIVVVDEAYIEFGGETVVNEIDKYDRLIVLRTLSKTFGAAGIRTGYLVSNEKIVKELNKVKPPYNLNILSQLVAIELVKNKEEVLEKVNTLVAERKFLYEEMSKINGVKVYPSNSNFILFKVNDGNKIFNQLLKEGVLVRDFNKGVLKNHLRVTVGNRKENNAFIRVLKEVADK